MKQFIYFSSGFITALVVCALIIIHDTNRLQRVISAQHALIIRAKQEFELHGIDYSFCDGNEQTELDNARAALGWQ